MDADRQDEISDDGFTSLDDSERFVQILLQKTEAQSRIHGVTDDLRTRLITSFGLSGKAGLIKRASRLADCCKWPLLFVKPSGIVGMSLQRCRDRLCPVCSRIRGNEIRGRISEAVQLMDCARFVTLTMQSTAKELDAIVRSLQRAFTELRRTDFWQTYVTGGVWTMEIKPGTREGTWNCHLHLLVDGEYIPQDQLADAWEAATGDSRVVHITAVDSRKKAVNYIAKYISKPGEFNKFSDDEIIQYAQSIKGKRMFGVFGKLHASTSIKKEETEDAVDSSAGTAISIHTLQCLDTSGFTEARTALNLLQRCGGYIGLASGGAWSPVGDKITEKDQKELARTLVYCQSVVAEMHEMCNRENERLRQLSIQSGKRVTTPPPKPPVQLLIDTWLHCKQL